jgi:hypothetical protein
LRTRWVLCGCAARESRLAQVANGGLVPSPPPALRTALDTLALGRAVHLIGAQARSALCDRRAVTAEPVRGLSARAFRGLAGF